MANPDPSRTEMPTAKKLGEARNRGNVLYCPDINSVVVLTTGTLLLFMTLPRMADVFRDVLLSMTQIEFRANWTDSQIEEGGTLGATMVLKALLPACLGICLAAIIVMRAQVGQFFCFEPLKWRVDQLFNPKAVMNEMLPSKQSMMQLLIATMKVFVVGWLIYISIISEFKEYLKLNMMPLMEGVMWVSRAACVLTFKIITILIAIAALNYWFKRKQYYDALMMTKQEVKDERKNQDGDPVVKGKIRSKMREIFIRALKGNLKKANVVVTNPTHVAVALKYDPGNDPAPIVVAKGLRKKAEHIKFMARAYGIPIIEAPPLARSLYRNVKVASFIPPEFYKAVAAILAKLNQKSLAKLKSSLKKPKPKKRA